MATSNPNRPQGFRPLRYLSGADWNGQAQLYSFNAANAVAAFIYDICSFDTTNRSLALTDNYQPALPNIQTVASDITTAIQRGVIVGFLPEPEFNMTVTASLGLKNRVASTKRYAWVIDDPFVVYQIQENGQSYTSAASNAINKTVGTLYTAGSTTTGVSGTQLKSADVQTAAARPMRVLRYSPDVNNFGFVAADNPSNAKFDVLLVNSDLFASASPATNFGA
jgi:hypothetical protein